MPEPYRRQRILAETEAAIVRAAGGLCIPWGPPEWEPWARWWPGFDYSIGASLPPLGVARGGIVTVNRAYLVGEEGDHHGG